MRRPLGVLLFCLACTVEGARLRVPQLRGRTSLSAAATRPQPTQPGNSTAATAYNAMRRDIIFFERLATLLLRTASRLGSWLQQWIARSIGFPPRVMVVQLSGVIAADNEMRTADSLLLYDESIGGERVPQPGARGRPGDGIINLARCDKLLSRAFAAHGARAVCILINSPGGSPAQSSLIYARLRALRKRYKRVPL